MPVSAFPEGVPLAVAKIVIRCLAVDPAERFADAGEVASVLEHYARPIDAATLLSKVDAAPVLPPANRPSQDARPSPASFTFARHKMLSTGGRTAFERHELVPRGSGEAPAAPMAHVPTLTPTSPASDRHGRALLLATLGGTAALLVVLVGLVAFSLGASRTAAPVATAQAVSGHGLVTPPPAPTLITEPMPKVQALTPTSQPSAVLTPPTLLTPDPPATPPHATAPKASPGRAPARAGTNSSSGSLYTDTKW
ncbi:Serine/threonine protein kinase PrkC, regulator of stationary phase [Labilithrix luteola]|uniref:Serine/threonine protein kinase PrkC, regulator of stationary phase n=1 Tax=Labilithrix luteola TaxID=1391654 RepID=A0A0K1PXH6_9BACT|nr:Serine/threonine protein kinase PrkC, regulator of stationary phase [Labilithrix luteola]